MLYRVIYASEAVGTTGATVLSVAQILGVSVRNNVRDHITSGVMFHQGVCLHAIEGGRGDVDRLLQRLRRDPRHTNLRILVDRPITTRRFSEPMALCDDPAGMLRMIGASGMAGLTAFEAERIVEIKQAA